MEGAGLLHDIGREVAVAAPFAGGRRSGGELNVADSLLVAPDDSRAEAVAVELATRNQPYGLVFEATLPSTLLVATHAPPWLPRWLAAVVTRGGTTQAPESAM